MANETPVEPSTSVPLFCAQSASMPDTQQPANALKPPPMHPMQARNCLPAHAGMRWHTHLVKVVPVAEDDVAAHVEQEALGRDVRACQTTSLGCLHAVERGVAKGIMVGSVAFGW